MMPKNNPFVVLLATTLSAFLTPFMGSALNVALPVMASQLSMSALTLSWVASAFLLTASISLVPLGRIADIYGRRKVFIYGAFVFSISSALCAAATSPLFLIVMRALQGTGGAMIFGTGTAMLLSAYPAAERGRILGINVAAVYIGLTAGPFIGGLLTSHLGWRYIFLLTFFFGGLLIALTITMIKEETPRAAGEKFDWGGSLIYAIALFALMYGLSLLPSWRGWSLALLGLIFLSAFIRQQIKRTHPLLDIRLFTQNRVFAFSNLAALINYCATFAVTILLSLYLQQIAKLSAAATGIILIAEPVVQAVFSPLAGRLSDRREPQIISSAGMALTAVGLLLLFFINQATNIYYIIFCLSLIGLGFALFSSPNVNAAMSSVNNKYYGVASATLGTMRLTGQMFSMAITMLVFSIVLGDKPFVEISNQLLLQSIKIILIILAILCTAGIFASAARGKMHRPNSAIPENN